MSEDEWNRNGKDRKENEKKKIKKGVKKSWKQHQIYSNLYNWHIVSYL